jgi:osmotically-inducible protein OsmY
LNVKTDREIEEDIKDQLWWSPFVDSDSIAVSVKGGVATLSGIANSRLEAEAAATNAREGGAKAVVNQLKIVGYPDVGFW